MHPYVHNSTILNSQDTETTLMSIDRRMDKEDVAYIYIYIYTHTHTHTHIHACARACTHTHTMEYYSAIKKNEIIPFTATWMDLEIIVVAK